MDLKWVLVLAIFLAFIPEIYAGCCYLSDINECFTTNDVDICRNVGTYYQNYMCCNNGQCMSSCSGVTTTTRTQDTDTPRPTPTPTTTTFCSCGYTTSYWCPSSIPSRRYYYGNGCGSIGCTECDICYATSWTPVGCNIDPCQGGQMKYTRTVYSGSCARVDCRYDSQCSYSYICTEGVTDIRLSCGTRDCGNRLKVETYCKDTGTTLYYTCSGLCTSGCDCSDWVGTGLIGPPYCSYGFEKQTRFCENNCDVDERCVAVAQLTTTTQSGGGSLTTTTQSGTIIRTTTLPPPTITVVIPTTTSLPPTNINPIGYHDTSTCDVSLGWACDPNNYPLKLTVEFYADGEIGRGTYIGSTTAELSSENAVNQLCGGTTNHRFSFQTPSRLKDGNQHSIYAYAVGNMGEKVLLPLSGGSRTFTCQQQLNLELEILPERYTLLRNEIFQITSRVYSGSSFIQGAAVTFTYRFNDGSTTTNLGSNSCTTNQNGECTVQYNTPNLYGSLIITANAQYQNYLPASNELTINVVDCFADQNCMVYEYCSNTRCIDLRSMANSCNYFDYCESGRIPGSQQPCVWGQHCYSRNVDQQLITPLCNDAGYRAHALVINCGGS